MSTEHNPASPAVAHTPGPWTTNDKYAGWIFEGGFNGQIVAADGTVVYAGPASFKSLKGRTEEEANANALLMAAAPSLLEACEKAAEVMGWMLWDQSDRRDKNEAYALVQAAIARARGLRPCDVPELVPEVLQAQPQCVHGERREGAGPYPVCPVHPGASIGVELHRGNNGGRWYTYVCGGKQRESGG